MRQEEKTTMKRTRGEVKGIVGEDLGWQSEGSSTRWCGKRDYEELMQTHTAQVGFGE